MDYIHRILECCGCDAIYFQSQSMFSENDKPEVTHWPTPHTRAPPEWLNDLYLEVDRNLHGLMTSVYVALDNDLGVLAAIGVRTAFDRATELLGVDPSLTFKKKLDELVSTGKSGAEERKILEVATDAGSAAAHRGWKPTAKQLETLMVTIEHFIYRNRLLPRRAQDLETKVPPKQPPRKPDTTKE